MKGVCMIKTTKIKFKKEGPNIKVYRDIGEGYIIYDTIYITDNIRTIKDWIIKAVSDTVNVNLNPIDTDYKENATITMNLYTPLDE